MEETIMNLIVMSGQSRSTAFEALAEAREGDFEKADELMKESSKLSIEAHEAQTQLLCDEVNGNPTQVSLMMVHAQDHLMDSILARELIGEMIKMLKDK